MKLVVLVTTMHQNSFDIYNAMNLHTDAVIANQADENGYRETIINGHSVKLITTSSRGLSRNRNIALSHAAQDANILLFSDDDLIFDDDYETKVISEFEKHPEAQAIKFNIHDISATRHISMARIQQFERATRRNMTSSGVVGLAIKQSVFQKNNLKFNEMFGAGTDNLCGEDTILIMEMLNRRVAFFRSPLDIAGIDQTDSSWFEGYNNRYFESAGAVIGTIYPRLSYLFVIRSAYRFSKRAKCTMKFLEILACYYKGIRNNEKK